MRALVLAVLLAGCGDDPDPSDDTVVDTDPADTDPTDTDPVCLDEDLVGLIGARWSTVADRSLETCLRSWRCGAGSEAAVGVRMGQYESSWAAYYDADGRLVGEEESDDGGACAEDQHTWWHGAVVHDCPQVDDRASIACALPPPGAGDGCFVGGLDEPLRGRAVPGDTWDDVVARADTDCFATATCTLGERTLRLAHQREFFWAMGRLDVWDEATGAIVAYAEFGGIHGDCDGWSPSNLWWGEDLSACLAEAAFAPTAACGLVTP